MTKKPYLSFLTSVRSLYQPILYTENDDTQGKRKKAMHDIFPFSPFLFINKPKTWSISRMCAYEEVK